MNQLSDILKAKRERHGWNKSQMAREIGVSSQLYGQYESGAKVPGGDFFLLWKKRFKTDLTGETETMISHEKTDHPDLTQRIAELEAENKAHGALLSVLLTSMAEMISAASGENIAVVRRKLERASEDVLKLG